jgi:ATP-dependent Clp protease ATP-binding subunit ClpC
MFDRFTEDARSVIAAARQETALMQHRHVGTEHLLVALAGEPEVAALGLDPERARAEVVKTVGLGDHAAAGELRFTAAAQEALEDALREAMRLGQHEIRPGHVLLGVLRQRDGVARRILVGAGATPSELRDAIVRRLEGAPPEVVDEDARALLGILARGGSVASALRRRGVDEDFVRRIR